jgi:hypothetical protein
MSETPGVENLGPERADPQWVAKQLRDDSSLGAASQFSELEAQRRSWRTRFRVWGEDGPSWLFSLILHCLAFLLITSLATPWTSNGASGRGTIALTLGFLPDHDRTGGASETIALPPGEPLDAEVNQGRVPPPPAEPSETQEEPQDVEPPAQPPPSLDAPSSDQSAAPPSRTPPRATGQGERSPEFERAMRVSPYAAILNRHVATSSSTSSMQSPTTAPRHDAYAVVVPPLTDPRETAEQQTFDQIVDDFIEYDVGRLRGAAGQRARERFAALGPEAFPALIRGLNKAAGIHASCPVGVIAGKVLSTLRVTNDPSLKDYALTHIGVGVDESAPHYQRLLAMRKHWLNGPALPPKVAAVIDRLEVRQEGELMELMLALSDAPSDTIVSSLTSGDDYLAAAATLSLIQGNRTWTSDQQAKLRAAVFRFRATTGNAQLRGLADDAGRALRRP